MCIEVEFDSSENLPGIVNNNKKVTEQQQKSFNIGAVAIFISGLKNRKHIPGDVLNCVCFNVFVLFSFCFPN